MVQHGRQTQVIAQGGATRKSIPRVWLFDRRSLWGVV
jgi:hypothetical protein